MLVLIPRLYVLHGPLDLEAKAVTYERWHDPWGVLPVSRAALTRALGAHVLVVTGAGLLVDGTVLLIAHATSVVPEHGVTSAAALFSLVTVSTTEKTPYGNVVCRARNPAAYKAMMAILEVASWTVR